MRPNCDCYGTSHVLGSQGCIAWEPAPDQVAGLRVVMEQMPEDGSWTVEVQLPDGRRLTTAGDDPRDALRNAAESWPDDLAALLDSERER